MTIEEMCQKMSDRVVEYRNDLEIDKKTITRYPDRKFLAFARDWGTHMIVFHTLEDLSTETDKKALIKDLWKSSMSFFSRNNNNYKYDIYYFDGDSVEQIEIEQAQKIVNFNYDEMLQKIN